MKKILAWIIIGFWILLLTALIAFSTYKIGIIVPISVFMAMIMIGLIVGLSWAIDELEND